MILQGTLQIHDSAFHYALDRYLILCMFDLQLNVPVNSFCHAMFDGNSTQHRPPRGSLQLLEAGNEVILTI